MWIGHRKEFRQFSNPSLSCNTPHRCSTKVSLLRNLPLYSFVPWWVYTPFKMFLFPLSSLAIATPQLGYNYTLAGYTDKRVIGESTVKLYITVSPSPNTRFGVLDVSVLNSKSLTYTTSMCRAVSVIICCKVRIPFKPNVLKCYWDRRTYFDGQYKECIKGLSLCSSWKLWNRERLIV